MWEYPKRSNDEHHVLVVVDDILDDQRFHDPDPHGLAYRSQVAEWLSELRINAETCVDFFRRFEHLASETARFGPAMKLTKRDSHPLRVDNPIGNRRLGGIAHYRSACGSMSR